MNSKEKGDIAVGKAISYYLSQIKEVLLPIGDKQKYDLVVDNGVELKRVQCKYTSYKTPHGIYSASIRQTGGNQSYHIAKKYNKEDFDTLFIVTEINDMYEIPFNEIKQTNCCNLGKKFEKYKVT